jgi:hypothetical protein
MSKEGKIKVITRRVSPFGLARLLTSPPRGLIAFNATLGRRIARSKP